MGMNDRFSVVKRILKVIGKIVLGIAAVYVILAGVVVPLAVRWVIPWQGSKILGTRVALRSVFFNPLLLRASINGLEVQDRQGRPAIGFDSLKVDVSFLALFKKIYRVESVELKGFRVNAVLRADGGINLLDLVPPATAKPAAAPEEPAVDAGAASEPKPLPKVVVDAVRLGGGEVRFMDESIEPNVATAVRDIALTVTGFSTDPDGETRVVLSSGLDAKGAISVEALVKPLMQPLALEASVSLNEYVLTALSPYVGKYTGRALADGGFGLKMDYRIADNKLNATHHILIQHFTFGERVESKDALPLPFGLALALLEDREGKIKISLPVKGDLSDPEFEYLHLIGQVARNFFMKLVTKPFSMLGSIAGMGGEEGTEEMSYIRFVPGQTNLADAEREKIGLIAKAMTDRPRLTLQIKAGYDPQTDWKAIQEGMFKRDYAELRAQSSRSDREVYEMLYQRRFGLRDLWELTKKYKLGVGDYDEKVIEEIKRQLVESAPPDAVALAEIAGIRAKAVYDLLITAGCDAARVRILPSVPVQASMGAVPLEFVVTVFGEE